MANLAFSVLYGIEGKSNIVNIVCQSSLNYVRIIPNNELYKVINIK